METVSILSPVYNNADKLPLFLESIYNQKYKKIELICVDDGSEDNSYEIVQSYKQKFREKGYILEIFRQSNSGAAKAVFNAYKNATGEYIMWCDSDDYLMSENVSNKVAAIKSKGKEFFAMSGAIIFDNNINKIVDIYERKNTNNLFRDLIIEKNVFFSGGIYMMTKEQADRIFNENFYFSRGGQNWQILLPLVYNYNAVILKSNDYVYFIHQNSHSHSKKNFQEMLRIFDEHLLICEKTLNGIGQEILSKWCPTLKSQNAKKKLTFIFNNERKLYKKYFNKNRDLLRGFDFLYFWSIYYFGIFSILYIIIKIKKLFYKIGTVFRLLNKTQMSDISEF